MMLLDPKKTSLIDFVVWKYPRLIKPYYRTVFTLHAIPYELRRCAARLRSRSVLLSVLHKALKDE